MQVFLVPNLFEPVGQKRPCVLGTLGVPGAKLQIVHIATELVQAAHRAAGQYRREGRRKQGFKQTELVLAGKHTQRTQCLMANAALGVGNGAQKGRVVVVVGPQAEPGAQIANLSAVKKALAARHLVRNIGFAQRFLKRLGLVVGAVEHRKVFELAVLGAGLGQGALDPQALDARHRALGLMLLVVGVNHPHRFAFAQVAPQVFGKQLRVGADHVVRRAQNCRGRAVVLLQLHHFERGKVQWQLFKVVQRGPAPAVDRLVVVAHGGKAGVAVQVRGAAAVRLAAHQQIEHLVLGGIGVLVFIHQHMAHARLPLGANVRMFAQQLERQADQVVKVHALVGA